jgi:hypothetical protein
MRRGLQGRPSWPPLVALQRRAPTTRAFTPVFDGLRGRPYDAEVVGAIGRPGRDRTGVDAD